MAAVARMVRDGVMVWPQGRRLPQRYWAALAAVEAAHVAR